MSQEFQKDRQRVVIQGEREYSLTETQGDYSGHLFVELIPQGRSTHFPGEAFSALCEAQASSQQTDTGFWVSLPPTSHHLFVCLFVC